MNNPESIFKTKGRAPPPPGVKSVAELMIRFTDGAKALALTPGVNTPFGAIQVTPMAALAVIVVALVTFLLLPRMHVAVRLLIGVTLGVIVAPFASYLIMNLIPKIAYINV